MLDKKKNLINPLSKEIFTPPSWQNSIDDLLAILPQAGNFSLSIIQSGGGHTHLLRKLRASNSHGVFISLSRPQGKAWLFSSLITALGAPHNSDRDSHSQGSALQTLKEQEHFQLIIIDASEFLITTESLDELKALIHLQQAYDLKLSVHLGLSGPSISTFKASESLRGHVRFSFQAPIWTNDDCLQFIKTEVMELAHNPFSPEAMEMIAMTSQGSPRKLVQLMETSTLLAERHNISNISVSFFETVFKNYNLDQQLPKS